MNNAIDHDLFRAVLGRFATGVTIVTTADPEGGLHGMTVSAFSSVSLDPPLVLVCIGKAATMAPQVPTLESFGVNILGSDQEELSRRFAGQLEDRFEGVGYELSPHGVPLLNDVLASLECRVVARHDAGDHVIVVGEVVAASVSEGTPLLYFRGGYAELTR